MSDYEIKCGKCNQPVTHICNEEFRDALKRLLSWYPEGMWSSNEMHAAFKAESKKQGDDFDFEQEPFFGSQAWSYLIWYKEDARSFHGVINNLIRTAGIDPYQLELELRKEREEAEKQKKELEEAKAKRRAERINK